MRRGGRQPVEQVPRALQIDLAIFLRAAAAGGNAIHDPIERPRQFREVGGFRDVRRDRFDARGKQFRVAGVGAAQAENFVTLAHQFRAQRQAHVTAADN